MTFDYGSAPGEDEIEISLFGPGYGEAIAVHLGKGAWILVDSCIDPKAKKPATEVYLDFLGIQPEQVKSIVASHWHDDHVRGLSQLVKKYSNADFISSAVFSDKDALAFLTAYSGESSQGLGRGAKELYNSIASHPSPSYAMHKSIVVDNPVLVTALSPVPATFSQSIAHIVQYLPKNKGGINNAPEIRPNYESIVLHIDLGDDAIILGSDLEDDVNNGWTAIIADQWSKSRTKASIYKVAHHGSKTGDCDQIWSTLLSEEPTVAITPWALAGNSLPSELDKQRLKGRSSAAYISSSRSRSPNMDSQLIKRLGDMASNIKSIDTGLGVVRFRKKAVDSAWNVELFGAAKKL